MKLNIREVSHSPVPEFVLEDAIPTPKALTLYQLKGKRLLDLALGVPLFLLFLPVMGVVALAVLVACGWPIFYTSERAGRHGTPLKVRKFRTMVRNADSMIEHWEHSDPHLLAEYSQNFKLRQDPRITPLGKILRKLSLDELPQLWDVVNGRLSLVGPRPYLFRELVPHPSISRFIWSVTPGITGPWQIQGRNDISPIGRMQLDIEYTMEVTLAGDLKYLLYTLEPKTWLNGV